MTRGRAMRWVIVGILCCAVAGLIWTFVRPTNSAGEVLAGYPERISKPYVERWLPDRPGPLAAIVEDNDFGNVTYHGVDEFGRVQHLPRTLSAPTLSPDGRRMLVMAGGVDQRLTVVDLVAGTRIRIADVGSDSRGPDGGTPAPYRTNGRSAAWAPDGARVAVTTTHDHSRKVPAWLDLTDGKVHELELRGAVAGWRSSDELVILESYKPKEKPRIVVATVVNVQSGVTRSTGLTASIPWKWSPSQASVSPSGSLLVANDRRFESFDLTTGELMATRQFEDATSCDIAWRGEDPIIGTKVYGTPARSMLLRSDQPPRSLVAVHPKFQSNCVSWAADAISGKVHRGVWGTNSARWTWYWREGLLFLFAVSVLTALVVPLRRKAA